MEEKAELGEDVEEKMSWIYDSHAHFHQPFFSEEEILKNIEEIQNTNLFRIKKIQLVSEDVTSANEILKMKQKYPQLFDCAVNFSTSLCQKPHLNDFFEIDWTSSKQR